MCALGDQLFVCGGATCFGNAVPRRPESSEAINANDRTVSSVLSGNGNVEGRIGPDAKMNYLASPPLVIAYALAGTMDFDFETQPLGEDTAGNDVYLKDIWPTNEEVAAVVDGTVSREMFLKDYASVFDGDHRWKGLDVPEGELFAWDENSTYVRKQTFFDGMKATPDPVSDIHGARVLALLGDSVTTDHISPAGAFKATSPAGKYLTDRGVEPKNFNSYGSRRGNHEVMVRGTFGNIRLRKNTLVVTLKSACTVLCTMAIVYCAGAGVLTKLFMDNEQIIAYGTRLLRGFCLGLPFLCVDFITVGVFPATGMGYFSFFFAILRKIILEIPILYVLNRLYPLSGLSYAQFTTEVILSIVAVTVLVRLFRKWFRENPDPSPQSAS